MSRETKNLDFGIFLEKFSRKNTIHTESAAIDPPKANSTRRNRPGTNSP